MTGRKTSHRSTSGLWTALITLLLFSVSVRSQNASAVNEAVPSARAAATESPPGSITSLRKADPTVEVPSTTLKPIVDRPEAVDSVEKIAAANSTKNKLDAASAQDESEKLKVAKVARLEEKRAEPGAKRAEFTEKEDYVDTQELEEDRESDREPTTPRSDKKEVPVKNGTPEDSGEKDVKAVEKTKPEDEIGISLADDTNVNYNKKPSKENGVLGNDPKALENATNVIASGEAGDTQLEKGKGPKAQVEVVKDSTLPKIQRIVDSANEAERSAERKDVESLASAKRENYTEVSTTAIPESKNSGSEKSKIDNLTVLSEAEVEAGKTEDMKTLPSPRGRTISFGGTNEFVTSDNKTRENGGITDKPIGIGITKEILQEHKTSEFKPYPYVKASTIYPANGSDARLPLSGDRGVPESTEEALALENTIGQRQQDKKFVVTEPSVAFDNSIQQFKPTYLKRSGNASRIQPSVDLTSSSTTVSSLELEVTSSSLPTTKSSALESNSTAYVGNLRVSSTENDVPQGKDEETKTSVSFKDPSSGPDLTGNGITEVVDGAKNPSFPVTIDDSGFTKTSMATTPSIARATETTQVQNSTEKISTPSDDDLGLTNMDVQTDSENSMLEVSPLNVTEGTTRIPSTEGVSSVETSTLSLPTTPSMPSSSSSSFSGPTEFVELTTTIAPAATTDVVLPLETLQPEDLSTTDGSIEPTTSSLEYEFVGLTESAVSQKYIASSESSNAVTDDREVVSSSTAPSSSESATSASIADISTTLGVGSSIDADSTKESIADQETSTETATPITESLTTEDSSTSISTLDFSALEESTTTINDNSDFTTTAEDFSTTPMNESPETTAEDTTVVPNVTKVPEVFTDDSNNTTDTGRAADPSSTSIPDASETPNEILGNSDVTLIGSTESSNLSVTTESSETIEISKESSMNSATTIQSTEVPTTTPELEISSTSQEPINTVSESPIGGRAAIPSLVRIVFEGNWADVCPHLPALRQSLADLLTSGIEKTVLASQIIFQKNPCTDGYAASSGSSEPSVTSLLLYVVDQNGNFDGDMTNILPDLYSKSPIKLQVTIHSFQLVQDSDSGNAIAVVVVSCVAFICLVLLAGLLFIMRKRQTRFNYGERCRPVSLDAYSLDSVSAYNSVRRKGAARASKRSYGNPTFEDSSAIPSHPLNFGGLATFCNEQNAIAEEFSGIPQVTARIDELPSGAEVKNRYANVVPLPETRVSLMKINNDPLTEYINASYVRGPKNATKYYIACQAPIESTVTDFWRMIWEQQSKVIIMLTDLVENGVEKCAEYIPPSEVTDCHRLFGDFQVTLKKRETKEKYAISTLHLKNLENNTFREISHIWYLWPANGVQSDAAGLIAVLLEARALQRGGPGPIVVHCSPGTGRTGTLIALDLGIRQYEITRTVDVPRVVYTIRRDRAGAVQTKEQYAFIYKALNLYATKLAGGALES